MKYTLSIILLVVLITFIILLNKRDFFQDYSKNSRIGICNFKTIYSNYLTGSNRDTKELIYNNKFGPTCLAKCIRNFGQNIQFTNLDPPTSNILEWNNLNPTKGFCYRANDDKYPFLCEGSDNNSNKLKCKDICGKDLNEAYKSNKRKRFYKYNPDIDFSNCKIDDKLGCVEKTLNLCSGNAYEKYIGCKKCIQQYMPSINTLNNLRIKQLTKENNEKCPNIKI